MNPFKIIKMKWLEITQKIEKIEWTSKKWKIIKTNGNDKLIIFLIKLNKKDWTGFELPLI